MKRIVPVALICGVLGLFHTSAQGQQHEHEEHKEQGKAPAKKTTEASKADGMKCCEGMEKSGEMKGDMKAKMEKMKAMKEKRAEKRYENEGYEKRHQDERTWQ